MGEAASRRDTDKDERRERSDGLLTTGDMARLSNNTLRTVRFSQLREGGTPQVILIDRIGIGAVAEVDTELLTNRPERPQVFWIVFALSPLRVEPSTGRNHHSGSVVFVDFGHAGCVGPGRASVDLIAYRPYFFLAQSLGLFGRHLVPGLFTRDHRQQGA